MTTQKQTSHVYIVTKVTLNPRVTLEKKRIAAGDVIISSVLLLIVTSLSQRMTTSYDASSRWWSSKVNAIPDHPTHTITSGHKLIFSKYDTSPVPVKARQINNEIDTLKMQTLAWTKIPPWRLQPRHKTSHHAGEDDLRWRRQPDQEESPCRRTHAQWTCGRLYGWFREYSR